MKGDKAFQVVVTEITEHGLPQGHGFHCRGPVPADQELIHDDISLGNEVLHLGMRNMLHQHEFNRHPLGLKLSAGLLDILRALDTAVRGHVTDADWPDICRPFGTRLQRRPFDRIHTRVGQKLSPWEEVQEVWIEGKHFISIGEHLPDPFVPDRVHSWRAPGYIALRTGRGAELLPAQGFDTGVASLKSDHDPLAQTFEQWKIQIVEVPDPAV